MKCTVHPNMDAVGTCVSCGRGVCEECKVRLNNLVHCKECVEAGRVKGGQAMPQQAPGPPPQMPIMPMPMPMRFLPRPRGPPRSYLYTTAFAGAMMSGILMIMTGGSVFSVLFSSSDSNAASSWFTIMVILTIVGFFLMAVGCYGIYWNFGTQSGILGIVGVLVMGPLLLWALHDIISSSMGYYSLYSIMFSSPFGIMFGVTGMILHLSIAYSRHFIPVFHQSRKALMFARGTSMVGVGFLYSILLTFVGFIIFGVALILFGIFFATAPMPDNPMYAMAGMGPPSQRLMPPLMAPPGPPK